MASLKKGCRNMPKAINWQEAGLGFTGLLVPAHINAKVFAGLSLVPSSTLGSKDTALTVQGLLSATHTLGETDDK